MTVDDWHLLIVGLGWVGGFATVAWSLLRDKILPYRAALYWLAMPIAAMMAIVYAHLFIYGVWKIHIIAPETSGMLVRIAAFFLSVEFFLVPWIDRLERRTKTKIDEVILPESGSHGIQ